MNIWNQKFILQCSFRILHEGQLDDVVLILILAFIT